MAKTIIETELKVTLVLTEDEAAFIKQLVQNAHPDWKEDEPPASADMRLTIFHALKDIPF